ncbi:MAG: helix-turn-helix domain-containing protein [Clostridia bacterium]|nr:helix-turn-helix domain-containing protein [Clostridia bacterium]
MKHVFKAGAYTLEYTESRADTPVIWENHCHTEFEMIAVLEGDISVLLEGRHYRLTENQTVIIPPLFYHTVTANKKGVYRRVTALFDPGAIPSVLQPHFLKKDAYLTPFYSSQGGELKRICQTGDPVFYEPLSQSLMTQILYEDARAERSDAAVETDSFLHEIISYIDAHLCEKILLDDLAAHTSRSKSAVCHLFTEKMSISPKQYILQKKLALAHKRITEGTPPTLAAMQVGYENYSSFYRMYQKLLKTAPSAGGKRKDTH